MADENNRAIVRVDRILQGFDRFYVEVIGRLIEEKQVGAGEHHHGQRNSCPLSSGKASGLAEDRVTREAKPSQVTLNGATSPGGAQIVDQLVEGAIAGHLGQVLPVV